MAHFKIYKKNSTWRVEQGMNITNGLGESMAMSTMHKTKTEAINTLDKNMFHCAKYYDESSTYDVYKANGQYDYGGIFALDKGTQ